MWRVHNRVVAIAGVGAAKLGAIFGAAWYKYICAGAFTRWSGARGYRARLAGVRAQGALAGQFLATLDGGGCCGGGQSRLGGAHRGAWLSAYCGECVNAGREP